MERFFLFAIALFSLSNADAAGNSASTTSKHLLCSNCNSSLSKYTKTNRLINCDLNTLVCECTTVSCQAKRKVAIPICNASKYHSKSEPDEWLKQCQRLNCKQIQAHISDGDPAWYIISHSVLYPGQYRVSISSAVLTLKFRTSMANACDQLGKTQREYKLVSAIPKSPNGSQKPSKKPQKATTAVRKSSSSRRGRTWITKEKPPVTPRYPKGTNVITKGHGHATKKDMTEKGFSAPKKLIQTTIDHTKKTTFKKKTHASTPSHFPFSPINHSKKQQEKSQIQITIKAKNGTTRPTKKPTWEKAQNKSDWKHKNTSTSVKMLSTVGMKKSKSNKTVGKAITTTMKQMNMTTMTKTEKTRHSRQTARSLKRQFNTTHISRKVNGTSRKVNSTSISTIKPNTTGRTPRKRSGTIFGKQNVTEKSDRHKCKTKDGQKMCDDPIDDNNMMCDACKADIPPFFPFDDYAPRPKCRFRTLKCDGNFEVSYCDPTDYLNRAAFVKMYTPRCYVYDCDGMTIFKSNSDKKLIMGGGQTWMSGTLANRAGNVFIPAATNEAGVCNLLRTGSGVTTSKPTTTTTTTTTKTTTATTTTTTTKATTTTTTTRDPTQPVTISYKLSLLCSGCSSEDEDRIPGDPWKVKSPSHEIQVTCVIAHVVCQCKDNTCRRPKICLPVCSLKNDETSTWVRMCRDIRCTTPQVRYGVDYLVFLRSNDRYIGNGVIRLKNGAIQFTLNRALSTINFCASQGSYSYSLKPGENTCNENDYDIKVPPNHAKMQTVPPEVLSTLPVWTGTAKDYVSGRLYCTGCDNKTCIPANRRRVQREAPICNNIKMPDARKTITFQYPKTTVEIKCQPLTIVCGCIDWDEQKSVCYKQTDFDKRKRQKRDLRTLSALSPLQTRSQEVCALLTYEDYEKATTEWERICQDVNCAYPQPALTGSWANDWLVFFYDLHVFPGVMKKSTSAHVMLIDGGQQMSTAEFCYQLKVNDGTPGGGTGYYTFNYMAIPEADIQYPNRKRI